MKTGAAVLATAAFVALLAGGSGGSAPGPRRLHVVEMRNFAFSPALLELVVGDTVVWINEDVAPHTATDSLGLWDSGELKAGGRWTWVAAKPGVYRYLCAYHPSMRASLAVRAGDATPLTRVRAGEVE